MSVLLIVHWFTPLSKDCLFLRRPWNLAPILVQDDLVLHLKQFMEKFVKRWTIQQKISCHILLSISNWPLETTTSYATSEIIVPQKHTYFQRKQFFLEREKSFKCHFNTRYALDFELGSHFYTNISDLRIEKKVGLNQF